MDLGLIIASINCVCRAFYTQTKLTRSMEIIPGISLADKKERFLDSKDQEIVLQYTQDYKNIKMTLMPL